MTSGDRNIYLTRKCFLFSCRSFNDLSNAVCRLSLRCVFFFRSEGGRKGPRPESNLSEPARNRVKCDKAATIVSTYSAIKHTCCLAVPCLEDGRPLRRQTTRAVMAVDVSAAPQPPNRLRPAETNQHIPVYWHTCREQLAKIKSIVHKHFVF